MQYNNLELIIQNSENGTIYDVSNIVTKITTNKAIESSAGKCSFSINTSVNKIKIPMGSTVSLKVNGKGKFFGFVFSTDPHTNDVTVTAYDQLRYLRNNESYVLTNTTHERLIRLIGNDFNLRLGTIEGVNYRLPKRVEDNKSLGDIIQRALDFTLKGTQKLFIIRDEFGYLCCRDVSKLTTNIVIGEDSLLEDFNYKEDIDRETYNQVKLYKDNKDTGKREVYITKDSNTQRKWGMLQLFENINEDTTDSQAREKAKQLLVLHNKIFKTLKLTCRGVLDLEPGNGVYLSLNDIPEVVFNQMALITSIEDTYENGIHKMVLEVAIE